MRIFSFPPIADSNASVLVLGTMPGIKSLEAGQYYAHPQNQFWKIMFALFDLPFDAQYDHKKSLLLENHIALWDVLKACEREGSLDSMIRNDEGNDFTTFLEDHKKIHTIIFNGQKAAQLFRRYEPGIQLNSIVMPSTSPAHTTSFIRKLEGWQQLHRLLHP